MKKKSAISIPIADTDKTYWQIFISQTCVHRPCRGNEAFQTTVAYFIDTKHLAQVLLGFLRYHVFVFLFCFFRDSTRQPLLRGQCASRRAPFRTPRPTEIGRQLRRWQFLAVRPKAGTVATAIHTAFPFILILEHIFNVWIFNWIVPTTYTPTCKRFARVILKKGAADRRETRFCGN